MPSVRGEATAGGHAARHTLLHTRTAHTTCTACNAGRLTAAGDQGPTTLCANSEEGADSPHSSDATELGPIGGELRVRNREPPAPSYTLRCARLHRTPCLHREPPAPTAQPPHSSPMCSGDLQDGALRSLEAGPLHVWRRLPVRSRRPRAPGSLPPGQVRRTSQEPTRLPCFESEASPRLCSTQVQDHRLPELRQRQVPVRSQVQLPSDRGLR